MKNISIENYRNIGISAHIDAGKTTTTERILFYSGVSHKIGEVHDGEAIMDWMDQEQERGITITSAATTVYWSGMNFDLGVHRINIIDTPGHVDFTVEVERCMRVIDSVCMIYCSVSGVQSQSETVWRQANKYNIPRLIFVNKMDRIGSDYFKVYNQIKSVLNGNPVPIFLPYFNNDSFTGLIDLLKFKIILWDDSVKGKKYFYKSIPDHLIDLSNIWREKMIESSIDGDDILIDKYLNSNLTDNEILLSLRKKTINCEIQPMLCGSSFKNKGVQCILDCILFYLPSPLDNKIVKGEYNNIDVFRTPDENDKFCALIFKIMSDPFVGQLVFFRVYSGIVNVGDLIFNSTKNIKERLGRILQMHSNNREDIKSVGAGNIAAAIGLKSVSTGDTICDPLNPIILEKIIFPEPVLSQYLEVSDKSDQDKLNLVLSKLSREDPSFKYHLDLESSQTIISGMGELHLEVIIERIKREYNLNLITGKPKVSYRETIRLYVDNVEGKYIRQSGGRGQYGHVIINLKPNIKGGGNKFIDNIKGGIIPKEYISSIEKGIFESLKSGVLAGYPVLDVIVYLVGGSFHEVDSSENAFKIAASIALKEGLRKADSFILEPIMNLIVETPDIYMGSVISNISSKRGILISLEDSSNSFKVIKSEIPLSETFGYSTSLRSLSQGRATFNMNFKCYSELPKFIYNDLFLNN